MRIQSFAPAHAHSGLCKGSTPHARRAPRRMRATLFKLRLPDFLMPPTPLSGEHVPLVFSLHACDDAIISGQGGLGIPHACRYPGMHPNPLCTTRMGNAPQPSLCGAIICPHVPCVSSIPCVPRGAPPSPPLAVSSAPPHPGMTRPGSRSPASSCNHQPRLNSARPDWGRELPWAWGSYCVGAAEVIQSMRR